MATLILSLDNTATDQLILDRETSIVLPEFDAKVIQSGEILSITLSLYILEVTPKNKWKIHLTINPFNPSTGEMDDGLSRTIQPRQGQYIHITLPRDSFEKIINTPKKLLLKLVDEHTKLVFEGVSQTSGSNSPILTANYSLKSSKEIIASVVNQNYYITDQRIMNNITNNQIGDGNIFTNQANKKSWQDNWLLYILILVAIAVISAIINNYLFPQINYKPALF